MGLSPSPFEFQGTARFQLLRRIGGGGMGVVYEAFDNERNVRLALKTLRAPDPNAVLRFKNEFRWLQDLQHPNLVELGELFCEEGQWFFTMELIDGVDLLSWVRPSSGREAAAPDLIIGPDEARAALAVKKPDATPRLHPLDEPRLREAVRQLAEVLMALHAAEKVHRDIKPSNVLVTQKGRLKLLDFGLAKQVAAGVSDSHVVGTVDYMAPEQAASRTVGPPADWYAVGTVLYEALTGQVPFRGPPLEVLMQKQHTTPPPPRLLAADVPADLEALCLDLLRVDPAERPGGAEVLRRLGLAVPKEVQRGTAPAAPFVGRRQELDDLAQAFGDAQQGGPVTVLVQGESGVGKSALVRRFVEELSRRTPQTVILEGRCYEREAVPYKAFDGVIDAISRHLGRLGRDDAAALLPTRVGLLASVFPVLRRIEAVAQGPLVRIDASSPQELRMRVFASLRELFARMGQRAPVVAVIDDLQWADADSLSLLREVLRPPEAPPLLLIATVRVASDSGSSGSGQGLDLPSLIPGDVRHVHVKRLPPEDAVALASLLCQGRSDVTVPAEVIAEEAGGHPLFIDELVRHLGSGGVGEPGFRLDDALWARVGRLDPPVRHLLEIIAVGGGPLLQETVAAAAAIDFAELGRRISILRSAHLLRTTGARRSDLVETYHDRVREAVLEHLDDYARRRSHERLALALEAQKGSDPELLLLHWRGAGDRERAAHYATLAAERAAGALAFGRAADLFRTAIGLRPVEAAALYARLGTVLANAGRGAAAAAAFLEAAKGASPSAALDLKRQAAEQLLISGHFDEGLAVVRELLAHLGDRLPETTGEALRALLWRRTRIALRGLHYRSRDQNELPPATLSRIDAYWSIGIGMGLSDNLRGADFQMRHLIHALDAGEPYRVVRALVSEAVYTASLGKLGRADRVLWRAERLAKELDHPHALGLVAMARGLAAYFDGRWREAKETLEVGETVLRDHCTGVAWELDTCHVVGLTCAAQLGELREVGDRLPALLRNAEERGDLYALTNLKTTLHVAALVRDDPERAQKEAAEAIAGWSRAGYHVPHYFELVARVESHLYAGDAEEAARQLEAGWAALEGSRLLRLQLVRARALDLRARVRLAQAAANPPERGALLAAAERDAGELADLRRPFTRGHARLLAAAAAALRGDEKRALAAVREAAEAFEQSEMRLHAQVARRHEGRLAGGEEGKALIAQSNEALRAERVKSPQRFAALLAPGFPDW